MHQMKKYKRKSEDMTDSWTKASSRPLVLWRRQRSSGSSSPASSDDDDEWRHQAGRSLRRLTTAVRYNEVDEYEDEDDEDEDDEDDDGDSPCRDYECPQCARRFPTKRFLNEHMRPNGKKCRLCCKRFLHYSNLANHMRVHTGEKPYSCAACGRAFSQLGNLRTHVRLHMDGLPFTCDVCHRQFNQAGHMAAHRCKHRF